MNAPSKKAFQLHDRDAAARPADVEREINEDGWFVESAASGTRPTARPKSSPPTGDDEVDRWLR